MADLLEFADEPLSQAAVVARARQMRAEIISALNTQRLAINSGILPLLIDTSVFMQSVHVSCWSADQVNEYADAVHELTTVARNVRVLIDAYDALLSEVATPGVL